MKLPIFAVRLLAILALGIAPLKPQAGESNVGNGGEVIRCYDQPVDRNGKPLSASTPLRMISIQPLDYWEWLPKSGLAQSLGPVTDDPNAKVRWLIERLRSYDPGLGRDLMEAFESLRFGWVKEGGIAPIGDRKAVLDPGPNCHFSQAAYQIKRPKRGQVNVVIDLEIFRMLSVDGKAGLLLHETVLRLAYDNTRVKFTDDVRRFNFMLSSTIMEDLSFDQYKSMLLEFRIFPLFPATAPFLYDFWKKSLNFAN